MLGRITTFMDSFIQDESGQGIIEYAGVLAFAAGLLLVVSANFGKVQSALTTSFGTIVTSLASMNGS